MLSLSRFGGPSDGRVSPWTFRIGYSNITCGNIGSSQATEWRDYRSSQPSSQKLYPYTTVFSALLQYIST